MRSVAVIGLGNFGSTVARELTDHGVQVIALDEQKERVEAIKESVAFAVALNTTDASALKSVAIQDVDIAIVCIGEDVEANLLTTLLLKKMGVKKIWARAINPLQSEILSSLDVDDIINLEEQMGKAIARSLASANVSKHVPLSPGHSVAEVKVPDSFIGKTLREIDPRKKHSVNVVAVKTLVPAIDDSGERTFEEQVDDVPPPDMKLSEDQVLLVAGSDKNIERFAKG
jgi:trk system potassium uptake protein TrkA